MSGKKILAIAGSMRRDSVNKKLLNNALEYAKIKGLPITHVAMEDLQVPVYNGDIEAVGLPENVIKLKTIFSEHDAFLFAVPEYNSSVAGPFKNLLDWVSRPVQGETEVAAFRNKTASLMSASPSPFGGVRGLHHLRDILQINGILVLPSLVTLANAYEAFDEQGHLKDPKMIRRVEKSVQTLWDFINR